VEVAFPLAVAFPAHCCSRLDVCFFFVLWWGGGFFGGFSGWIALGPVKQQLIFVNHTLMT